MTPTYAVILLAAGEGRRFNGGDSAATPRKPFVLLAGQPLWLHSAMIFRERADVVQTIVVVPPSLETLFRNDFADTIARCPLDVVTGGAERYDSVTAALRVVRDDAHFVAIHDTARPCVTPCALDAVFAAAAAHGAAILAAPLVGTLKQSHAADVSDARSASSTIAATVPRDRLWEAHTPQVFERELICRAYAARGDFQPTDDSQLVERLGTAVHLVPSERTNIKVTTPDDLALAAAIVASVRSR